MRILNVLCAFVILFVRAASAQLPDTPAGRQFGAWLKARNSGDRAIIQQFIDKNMPWGRIEQELAMNAQSGGYDVKKVEQSTDTHIVVLAQERGPAKQFSRILMDVEAAEPHQIAGIRIQPAQPPADMAPPKMTPEETVAARKSPPFLQFSAWLEAF